MLPTDTLYIYLGVVVILMIEFLRRNVSNFADFMLCRVLYNVLMIKGYIGTENQSLFTISDLIFLVFLYIYHYSSTCQKLLVALCEMVCPKAVGGRGPTTGCWPRAHR